MLLRQHLRTGLLAPSQQNDNLRRESTLRRSAFTLMEIIVVVAIILILASAAVVVLPRFIDEANVGRAQMDVKTIEKAVMAYKVKKGEYPPDLLTLTQRDQVNGMPAYLEHAAIIDPWHNEYIYQRDTLNQNTSVPLIMSNGPPNSPIPIRNWADQY